MKRTGFTIAETLVTLALVGTLATLLLPGLVSSYEQRLLGSQLATAIANFESAFQNMMATEGVTSTGELHQMGLLPPGAGNFSAVRRRAFAGNLGRYLSLQYNETDINWTNFYNNNRDTFSINGTQQTIIASSSARTNLRTFDSKTGATYFIFPRVNWSAASREATVAPRGGNLFAQAAEVYIDVNGKQAPNTAGRDIFQFILGTDGVLYPAGGLDFELYESNGARANTWRDADSIMTCTDAVKDSFGFGCTARLIDNNFRMDY